MPYIKVDTLKDWVHVINSVTNYVYPDHKKDDMYGQEAIKAQSIRVKIDILRTLARYSAFSKILDGQGNLLTKDK